MKRYLAIAVALVGVSTVCHAQSSGTITISGTVATKTTIGLSQSSYSSLNIADGTVNQTVATVTEKCNSRIGYVVTLSSLNAGTTAQATLKGAAIGNNDTVNYTMKYGGTDVTLTGGVAVVTNASKRTEKDGTDKTLSVSIASSWVNTDTYSDTLTLTIAAQ